MPPVSEVEAPVPGRGATARLSRAECLCPVCLEIFMEPVTLPCCHSFCKPCFLETVDKANMCCPLCRKRVSTWARLHGRNKTLVNEELWRQVQAAFPVQCQRRLSGQEEVEENILVPRPKVSLPGEVRKEYEDQVSKLAEEKRVLEEAERKASEEYIQHLLAEEEERVAEERRRTEERQLEDDEKLAKLLSKELNPSSISESQRNRTPAETPAKKKANPHVGDIEKFLMHIPQRHGSVSDKENILHMETNHWSSKEPADLPMPSLDFYGLPESCPVPGTATSSPAGVTEHPVDAVENSLAAADPRDVPAKRRSCFSEESSERDVFSKRSRLSSSSSSSSSLYPPYGLEELVGDAPLLQELAQREEVLFSRRQQEEKDRQLALQLQRQLNREEASRAVDRRKGSSDPYQLRQNSAPERTGSSTPRRAPSRASSHTEDRVSVRMRRSEASSTATRKESASPCDDDPPSTPLKRGSKQATLTEMFHTLDS